MVGGSDLDMAPSTSPLVVSGIPSFTGELSGGFVVFVFHTPLVSFQRLNRANKDDTHSLSLSLSLSLFLFLSFSFSVSLALSLLLSLSLSLFLSLSLCLFIYLSI